MEYVGHLLSSEGTSFNPVKRLEVLDFPLPTTEKALQFIGLVNYFRDHVPKTSELVNYFRDHVPKTTEMVKPLRALIDLRKYKRSKQLNWTEESMEAFNFCRA